MTTRLQDKVFGRCEICEQHRELTPTRSASGEYYADLCWECLGEVEEGSSPHPPH